MPILQPSSRQETLSERIRDTNQRLSVEFGAHFSLQDIERVVAESLDTYKGAPVLEFVPLFVERATRERLRSASASTSA